MANLIKSRAHLIGELYILKICASDIQWYLERNIYVPKMWKIGVANILPTVL